MKQEELVIGRVYNIKSYSSRSLEMDNAVFQGMLLERKKDAYDEPTCTIEVTAYNISPNYREGDTMHIEEKRLLSPVVMANKYLSKVLEKLEEE